MCGPAAVSVLQTGVKLTGDVLAANAQNQHAEAEWQSAYSDLIGKYNATQLREQQEMAKTSQEIINAQKQGATNAGRIRVQAASGGVVGNSVTEREAEPQNAVSNFASTAKMNLAGQLEQEQLDAKGYLAKAKSVINENQTVNPLALGVQVAGDIAGGAASAMGTQPGGG